MPLQTTLPIFEIKSEAQGLVIGYASVFGGVDSYGDSIAPGAYTNSLAEFKANRSAPVMLWSHAQDSPIGRWINLEEDARGLRVEGQLNLKTAAGQQAFEHLRAGDINGLSIGYSVPAGGSQTVDGVTLLRQIKLLEISIVALPADVGARVSSVKALPSRPLSLREFEKALHALGFTRSEAIHIAANGFAGASEVDQKKYQELSDLRAVLKSLKTTFSS
jgi:HK97 family phage prohead protease